MASKKATVILDQTDTVTETATTDVAETVTVTVPVDDGATVVEGGCTACTPKVTVRDNPYLTDEEKDMLIEAEISRMMTGVGTFTRKFLINYIDDSGASRSVVVSGTPDVVPKLWSFFKENRCGSAEDFMRRVSRSVSGTVTVVMDYATINLA